MIIALVCVDSCESETIGTVIQQFGVAGQTRHLVHVPPHFNHVRGRNRTIAVFLREPHVVGVKAVAYAASLRRLLRGDRGSPVAQVLRFLNRFSVCVVPVRLPTAELLGHDVRGLGSVLDRGVVQPVLQDPQHGGLVESGLHRLLDDHLSGDLVHHLPIGEHLPVVLVAFLQAVAAVAVVGQVLAELRDQVLLVAERQVLLGRLAHERLAVGSVGSGLFVEPVSQLRGLALRAAVVGLLVLGGGVLRPGTDVQVSAHVLVHAAGVVGDDVVDVLARQHLLDLLVVDADCDVAGGIREHIA